MSLTSSPNELGFLRLTIGFCFSIAGLSQLPFNLMAIRSYVRSTDFLSIAALVRLPVAYEGNPPSAPTQLERKPCGKNVAAALISRS